VCTTIGRRGLRRLASLEFAEPAGGLPGVPVDQTAGRVIGRAAHAVTAAVLQYLVVESATSAQGAPDRRGGHVQN